MIKMIGKLVLGLSIFLSISQAEWNYKYDIGIMTGGIGGTYIKFGRDLMKLMQKKNGEILVRPIVSIGSQNNLLALKKSPGVDLAIVQADVMKTYKESGALGSIIKELRYITYLYDEEIHIAVKKDSSMNSFRDLNGKKFAIGSKGSGTELTAKNIITLMNLNTQKINIGFSESMQKLKSGEIDAVISVGGKPLSKFTSHLGDIKFLSVSPRGLQELNSIYVAAKLTSSDYSSINAEIQTIAVPSILACYNWTKKKSQKRYKGLETFVKTFHNNLEFFKSIGNADKNQKWNQINFSKSVTGWKRHKIVHRYDVIQSGDL